MALTDHPRALIAALFALIAVSPVTAQEAHPLIIDFPYHANPWIGASAGGVWSIHTSAPGPPMQWFDVGTTEATGFGWSAGINSSYRLGARGSLNALVSYGDWSATLRSIGAHATLEITGASDSAMNGERDVPIDFRGETSYELLTVAMMYEHRILGERVDNVAVGIGPALGFVTSSNNRSTITLDQSVEGRFANPMGLPGENSGRVLVLYDGDVSGIYPARFSVIGGLRYYHSFSEYRRLWIGAHADIPITGVAESHDIIHGPDWRATAFVVGVGYEIGL